MIPASGMSDMPKRDMPEWDGFGNKFEWILDAAIRLREERNGNPDRTRSIPDLRLYISGRLVDLPQVPVRNRALVPRLEVQATASVARIEDATRPAHTVCEETDS